jgi:hypothetical protein
MSKKKIRAKLEADNNHYTFEIGKRYVFSRRKFIKNSGKRKEYGYYDCTGWIKHVRGVVFTVDHHVGYDNPEVNGFGISRAWCTELK